MSKSAVFAVMVIVVACVIAGAVISNQSEQQSAVPPFATALAPASGPSAAVRMEPATSSESTAAPEKPRPVASKDGPWPVADIEETTHNFGRLAVGGAPGEYVFTIHNRGDAELELQAGKSTCQCTKFQVERERVAPGASTKVYLQWKLETVNAMFRHGGPVYTNDPERPVLDFAVEGVVDRPLEMFPLGTWQVEGVYHDRPGRMRAMIASRIHEKFEVVSIRAKSEFVQLQVNPLPSETLDKERWLSGYSVDVQVSSDIPGGAFEDNVEITVDVIEQPFVIPLRARKQGIVKYLPMPGTMFDVEQKLLKLGTFAASQGQTGQLMLIVNHEGLDEALEIVSKESTPSFVRATLEPTGAPTGNTRRYILTVAVPPGGPRVQHSMSSLGQLRLQTNHPNGEIIHVDLLFSSN